MEPTWDERLSCGIKGIDHQHQEILARLDYFCQACDDAVCGNELLALLEFLDNYAVVHFAEEEGLLEDAGYPELKKHRQQHREFLEKLCRLRAQIIDTGADNSAVVAMKRGMRLWLIEHIGKTDRGYVPYLKQRTTC